MFTCQGCGHRAESIYLKRSATNGKKVVLELCDMCAANSCGNKNQREATMKNKKAVAVASTVKTLVEYKALAYKAQKKAIGATQSTALLKEIIAFEKAEGNKMKLNKAVKHLNRIASK